MSNIEDLPSPWPSTASDALRWNRPALPSNPWLLPFQRCRTSSSYLDVRHAELIE
jgi:hypothetical protein